MTPPTTLRAQQGPGRWRKVAANQSSVNSLAESVSTQYQLVSTSIKILVDTLSRQSVKSHDFSRKMAFWLSLAQI